MRKTPSAEQRTEWHAPLAIIRLPQADTILSVRGMVRSDILSAICNLMME
jgi:hypothetical protein